jgi:hypothetical protein
MKYYVNGSTILGRKCSARSNAVNIAASFRTICAHLLVFREGGAEEKTYVSFP